MEVWIDQDKCTGDGLCVDFARRVFLMHDDGYAYVQQGEKAFDESGEPIYKGAEGVVTIDPDLEDAVKEAADDCPGECIYIRDNDGNIISGSFD